MRTAPFVIAALLGYTKAYYLDESPSHHELTADDFFNHDHAHSSPAFDDAHFGAPSDFPHHGAPSDFPHHGAPSDFPHHGASFDDAHFGAVGKTRTKTLGVLA